MNTLQVAMNAEKTDSYCNKIAARQLISDPTGVMQAIAKLGGNWTTVMENVQDWAQSVSCKHIILSYLKTNSWPLKGANLAV